MDRTFGLQIIDHIIIDTNDKVSGTGTNCVVDILSPATTPRIYQLLKFGFALVYDNVTPSTNQMTIAGTGVTIATGSSDESGLLSELNTKTAAAIANYTWTFDDNRRYTITNDLAANFTFVPGEMSALLGFSSTGTYTGASSYTGEYYPNLQINKDYFTLHSKALSNQISHGYRSTSNIGDLVAFIPNTQNYGSYMTYIPEEPIMLETEGHKIKSLDLVLRDSAGDVVDIGERNMVLVFARYSSVKLPTTKQKRSLRPLF